MLDGPIKDMQLTAEKATAMLSSAKKIHTFRNAMGMWLGADMTRIDLVKAIKVAKHRVLSGPTATAMGHKLCISDKHGALFIETKK